MSRYLLIILVTLFSNSLSAQLFKKPHISGMYFQWGYNRDWYTKSDVHFKDGDKYDFTIYDMVARDQPDFGYFKQHPLDITIPQNSYRIGIYLNKEQTHAIEINYDHAKYVQIDNQTLRMKGQINGKQIDADTNLGQYFVHLEHTNGANFYHLNYVGQTEIWHNKKKDRKAATLIWKAGGGIVIPKSFVILMYQKLDNKFHVAGYIFSGEVGTRYYPGKNIFLEATVKGGYANYLNSLAIGTGHISHSFGYFEVVGLVGYDLHFGRNKRKQAAALQQP